MRRFSRLAILSALTIVLRLALIEFPNVKPVSALFFVGVVSWGLADSLIVMSVSMVLSGLLFGASPIIFGQLVAYALILGVFSLLKSWGMLWQMLSVGVLIFVYGFVLSIFSVTLYGGDLLTYWLTGLPFDAVHALSTLIFYPILEVIFLRLDARQKI
jgi:hypothetical protein